MTYEGSSEASPAGSGGNPPGTLVLTVNLTFKLQEYTKQ
jgi:hypothetical protein